MGLQQTPWGPSAPHRLAESKFKCDIKFFNDQIFKQFIMGYDNKDKDKDDHKQKKKQKKEDEVDSSKEHIQPQP